MLRGSFLPIHPTSEPILLVKPVDVGQLLALVRSRVPLSHASARGEWEDEEHPSR